MILINGDCLRLQFLDIFADDSETFPIGNRKPRADARNRERIVEVAQAGVHPVLR